MATDRPPDDARDVAARELYALPAEEFTAARNARAKAAKAAGDRTLAAAIAALPRPSAAAWVLNQLARRRATEVEALLDLGGRLRAAHAALDADRIRALGTERHQQVAALARASRALAAELGRPVSDAVEREIEGTLGAAVATAEAGEAVRSGRLTKALSYAGFGAVDLTGVLAVPRRLAAVPDPPPSSGERVAEPEPEPEPDPAVERRRIQQAEQRERAVLRARTSVVNAERRLAELRAVQEELRTQLTRAGERIEKAETEVRRVAERLADLQGPTP